MRDPLTQTGLIVPDVAETQQHHARAGHVAPSALQLLTRLNPHAIALVNAMGVISHVDGAWEELTGLLAEHCAGEPISRFLSLNGAGVTGLLGGTGGSCETAVLRGIAGERRVRVSWRRDGEWTACAIEPLSRQAEVLFEWERELQERREQVDALVRCLGLSLDAFEGAHVERVTHYAMRLGEQIGLGPDRLRSLRWGALLHDVGKSRLPDTLLLKDSALTEAERGRMQQHPGWGSELLSELDFLGEDVRAVVLYHHERWDGQGYPRGLAGRDIPLLARVVAIADVFDALTSERTYKPAWDHRDAARHLLREAGWQFDPELTWVFVRNVLRMPTE